jgi:DUF1009 family protein/predicted dehydrogenase
MKIGLIAGSGQFPLIFSKKAKEKGFAVYTAAYVNEADPGLKDCADAIEWVRLGQIGRIIRFFRKHDVTDAVMMGAIKKTRMFTDVRPDIKAISILAGMIHTHDDGILRAFATALEKEGIRIQESTFLLPELLATEGCWTRRNPTRSERADIDVGWKTAKEIGRLDIGQCLVLGGGSVLAVEAIDGTDATILRGARLGKGAVVVKVCKPNQDMRFDIPAVGVQTIQTMQEAGAKVLVIEAGKTVVFDREEMIALADKSGISIIARNGAAKSEDRSEGENSQHPAPSIQHPAPSIQHPASSIRHPAPSIQQPASSTQHPTPHIPHPTPKLRVGVVGVGYLGKFHAEKYFGMEHVALAGVADTDSVQANAIAEKFGTTGYQNYEELLGKVDAVSIAAPTPAHFEISKYFLENDVDVLIEKPMTTTLDEANKLIELAESRGLIMQVGHLERFNPAVVALRDIVKKPLFIESHRLSIYKGRSMDVSVVLDLMIHDIDIILNFVRSPIKSIHASGSPVVSGNVDIANARLEFENGCVANVTASRISMKNERKIRLFQRDAYISVDFASREITVVRMRGGKYEEILNSDEVRSLGSDLIPGMDIKQMCFSKGDALEDELRSFVRAVMKRETSEVTGQMGRDALNIALNIMDQIKSKYGEVGGLLSASGS